jgi:hypothetical protein
MSALSVEPPYPAFADADGQPLENGYIFIGAVNLNPIVNPIAAFFDAALTIPAVQPIRTSGGYPVYQGTPTRFYVGSDYSIQVQDKNGSVVYTSLNGNAFPGSTDNFVFNAVGTGAQTIFAVPFLPSRIYINGVYQNKNTYTLSLGSVTFSQAPPLTSIIEFVF